MQLKIETIDAFGRGIAHDNGQVCFVKKALPNETVIATVISEKKKYKVLDSSQIITASPHRQLSYCPYSNKCGGCTYDICNYAYSLKLKKEIIQNQFQHQNIELPNFQIIKSEPSLEYRNKISLKVENYKIGFYEEKTHHFISIDNCLLAKKCLQNIMHDFSLFSFKEGSLTIRCNEKEEILLIIDTQEQIKIAETLMKKHKIVGIIKNKQLLYGKPYLYEQKNNVLYKISYNAFFQINNDISNKIMNYLLKYLNKNDIVLDLYCGVGFFSLKMAKYVKKVLGIEVIQNAIIDALKNKQLNNLENVTFLLGKVEDKIDKIAFSFTKVIIDPPRSGLDKKTILFLLKKEIPTIFYISCNLETLVRDITFLKEKYTIEAFQAFDMFAYTKHIECVCILRLH